MDQMRSTFSFQALSNDLTSSLKQNMKWITSYQTVKTLETILFSPMAWCLFTVSLGKSRLRLFRDAKEMNILHEASGIPLGL